MIREDVENTRPCALRVDDMPNTGSPRMDGRDLEKPRFKRENSRLADEDVCGSEHRDSVPRENDDFEEKLAKDEVAEHEDGSRTQPRKAFAAGMRLKKWLLQDRIGAGSFGETFTAIEIPSEILEPLLACPSPSESHSLPGDTEQAEFPVILSQSILEHSKKYCIKIEHENKNSLRLEAVALKKLQESDQVPRYVSSGRSFGANYLVMEKLGPSLAELRRRMPYNTFNIFTMLKVGLSCLRAIEKIHEMGYIHRDIKPSNFVIGVDTPEDRRQCYLIDFGLARRYRRSNGEIRRERDQTGFRGTSRYASVRSHRHQELGRADDLWCLLFMLVEFATGTLPWRKCKDKEEIGNVKEKSITPMLVKDLPREFQTIFEHMASLDFSDRPDYDLIIGCMEAALVRRQYPPDRLLDWEITEEETELAPRPSGGRVETVPLGIPAEISASVILPIRAPPLPPNPAEAAAAVVPSPSAPLFSPPVDSRVRPDRYMVGGTPRYVDPQAASVSVPRAPSPAKETCVGPNLIPINKAAEETLMPLQRIVGNPAPVGGMALDEDEFHGAGHRSLPPLPQSSAFPGLEEGPLSPLAVLVGSVLHAAPSIPGDEAPIDVDQGVASLFDGATSSAEEVEVATMQDDQAQTMLLNGTGAPEGVPVVYGQGNGSVTTSNVTRPFLSAFPPAPGSQAPPPSAECNKNNYTSTRPLKSPAKEEFSPRGTPSDGENSMCVGHRKRGRSTSRRASRESGKLPHGPVKEKTPCTCHVM